jgi:hypothetical protein
LRLRSSFEHAGIAHKLRYALNVLSLMREVQELGDGYWFPTPLRLVPIEKHAILLAPVPTHELRRHFHDVTRAGYARVLPQLDTQDLPIQELDEWAGANVRDSVTWSNGQIANALMSMGPTISSGNVQFFSVRTTRLPFGAIRNPIWADDSRFSLCVRQDVVLCRERVGRAYFRHFLGLVKSGRLVAEAPVPDDITRLQFGLSALAGQPITIRVDFWEGQSVFHVPGGLLLPRSERRLLYALGVRDYSLPDKAYRVCGETFVSIIHARLRSLGCEVRTSSA